METLVCKQRSQWWSRPGDHTVFELLNLSDEALLEQCEVSISRGSGPGGTKADATESSVRITHEPTGISVTASEERSQQANRRIALRRLRQRYALQERHDLDPDRVKVPEALREYVETGLRINPKNPHYPFLVKLVLDVFRALKGRLSDTADVFEVSTNQLARFLKRDGDLHAAANTLREAHGHGPVR